MADLGGAAVALIELVGPLLGPALGVFLRTIIGMALLGLCTAGVAAYVARGILWHAVVAAVSALVICATCGALLAFKRTIALTLSRAFSKVGAGKRLVNLLFESLQKVLPPTITAETVPISMIESLLEKQLVRAATPTSTLRRRIARALQDRIARAVTGIVLDDFRQGYAKTGSVSVEALHGAVALRIDGLLSDRFERASGRLTVALVMAAFAASLAVALILRALPAR